MKSEVVEAIRMLAKEKEIDESRLFTMIEEALKAAYRKNSPRNEAVPSMLDVHVDRDTGAISVFAKKTIVEEVEMPTNQITLEEAQKLDCRFAGLDLNPEAIAVCQNRLPPKDLTVACPCGGEAVLLAENDTENGRFTIGGLEVSHPDFSAKTTPLDSLESWETGVIRDGVFYADQSFRRSFRYPELQQSLKTEQAVEAVMSAARRALG